ncbi:hypothetical protein GYA93_05735 [Gordonia desulfuricans]|uniref:WXG100 family type VII secretion target n=1 Tax=Gordonia desulfuricans TaxID=89051 RepID=A0A7K3LLH5_9ACTN|nr:hypothetical protein [Gordonia desulfuricans]NDK89084.1 hypothetical protein [Gordonia desulfuricans]
MTGADGAHMRMDVDQVTAVVGYYRRVAQVVDAAAADLDGDAFGSWCGPDHDELGRRFAQTAGLLADRLRVQAASASSLAETLGRGVDHVVAADDEAAGALHSDAGTQS